MKLFSKADGEKIKVEKNNVDKGVVAKKVFSFLKRHIKLLVVVVLLVIVGIVAFRMYQNRQRSAAMASVATITTESIERKTLSNTISITGTIAAKDSQTVYSNNQGCEVTAINVEIGDYVNAGDVIATLDASDYEDEIAAQEKKRAIAVEKANLSAEQAARDLAEASIDASTDISRAQEDINDACEDYSAVVDSKSAAYNDYLLAVDATNSAKEKRDKLYTTWSKLKKQLKNDVEEGTISENSVEYEEQNAAVASAKAAYDAAEAEVSTAEKNESSLLSTYESFGDKLTSAVRNYESALEKQQDTTTSATRALEKSQDSVTNAELESATVTDEYDKQIEEYQKQIDKCTITAAISGVVTSIPMEVGDEIANDNNEICVIQDDSAYIVEATVDQYDISSLYKGMEAVIKTDATDDLEMSGVVTFVSPTPSTENGSAGTTTSYPIEIAITDKDDRLRIGMTAETSVITEQVKDVLAVPYDCIETDEDGNSIIYVVDETENMTEVSGNNMTEENAAGNGGDGRKNGGRPQTGNGERPDSDSAPQMNQRAVVVETGLETDYYTEISSDEISEGMLVIVPNSITGSAGAGDSETETNAAFSIGGGGMGGGDRGGMGGGGMGGGPGGF